MDMKQAGWVLTAVAMITIAGCGDAPRDDVPDTGPPPLPDGITALVPEVVRRMPHDDSAYTQGLVFRGDTLFESTGRYGESTLRVLDPKTGAVVKSVKLPPGVFGEGLAATADALVQITWKEMIAYYYDPSTLEVKKTAAYDGEGWGLCSDGASLYMTSGGDQLIRRDPVSFVVLGTQAITRGGEPLGLANELECDGEFVWANVYGSTKIMKIEKTTGRVVAEVDASGILPFGVDPRNPDQVLNGIAYNTRTQTFYITGKLWPEMLEVRFVPR